CRSQANKLRWPSELLSTCARSAPPSIATSSLCLPVSMPAHTVVSLLIFVDPFLVMRTLGSFNHPGPMKNRSRACSAAALAARDQPIRRPAARSRWPPGPGRSSRNGRTIAVRANTRSGRSPRLEGWDGHCAIHTASKLHLRRLLEHLALLDADVE